MQSRGLYRMSPRVDFAHAAENVKGKKHSICSATLEREHFDHMVSCNVEKVEVKGIEYKNEWRQVTQHR